MPPGPAAFFVLQLLALAGLVGNAAAGLASRLAGSLALTAAAVLSAVAQVASFNGNDMLHGKYLHKIDRYNFNTDLQISQSLEEKYSTGSCCFSLFENVKICYNLLQ